MAMVGAYEKNGFVIIECSDADDMMLTWQDAIRRAKAIRYADALQSPGRRELDQRVIELIIAAAVEARKKSDPTWTPSAKVSMYRRRNTANVVLPNGQPGRRLILPDS